MKLLLGRIGTAGAIVAVAILLAGLGLGWHLGRVPGLRDKPRDPLRPAADAYSTGDYKTAEAEAVRVRDDASESDDPEALRKAVEAQSILAYSAARQKDFALARERFEVMRREAAKLPDKGKPDSEPGGDSATLEQDAAYQHAVCTAAMGDKKTAEAEYLQFIRERPDSPLIYGAIQRIERLHDGKLPEEAEKVFQQAQKTVREYEQATVLSLERLLHEPRITPTLPLKPRLPIIV